VKQEMEKTMEQVQWPSRALAMWRSSGALGSLVPELARQDTIAFAAADHTPLPGATRRPDRVDARRTHRILSLFLGLPAAAVQSALRDLRFSNADVRTMTKLAEHWTALFARVTEALSQNASPGDAVIRRWAATTGRTQLGPFLRLAEARWAAIRAAGDRAPSAARAASLYRRAVHVAYRDPIELADLQVDGEDLQREGIARGPELGKILRALLEWVVEDPSRNTREALTTRATQLTGDT